MSVKLIYKDIAVGADEDAKITAPAAQSFSRPAMLPFGIEPTPIDTGELNAWGLTGKFKMLNRQQVGFWSKAMSDEKGEFAQPLVMDIRFDNKYISLGIYFEFDVYDFCRDLTISWYNGDSLLSEKRFYPKKPQAFCANTVKTYDRIVIHFNATSLPYRYLKISKILFGVYRTFYIDELHSVHIIQEADPISSELAINTMDWTLISQEDIDFLFQAKQPVEAYDNDTLIGVFYVDKSTRKAEHIYDVSCIDAVGILDESDFPAGIYTNKNAKELITEILAGDFALEMDDNTSTVTGYLSPVTRREAIQQIAFAIGAVVDTSGSSSVIVKSSSSVNPKEIPEQDTFIGGSVSTDAVLTAVKVTAHTYTQGAGESGDDVVEVNGVKYVHKTSIYTLDNPEVVPSDKRNVLEVKEATLVNPSNVAEVAKRVFDYRSKRETLEASIVLHGEKPGDAITVRTPYKEKLSGIVESMSISLSGLSVADVTFRGA